jgi:hypothetical protein
VSILKSETIRRFLLVAGSLVFAYSLIEFPALINVIDYRAIWAGGIWGSLRFPQTADPELINRWPPHAHYRGSASGGMAETFYRVPPSERTLFRWDLQFDRMGFRNEADLSSADTIVIGDSVVEGDSVSNNEVVTSVLQGLDGGKTVANLSRLGYGPQQEMIVLQRYGLPLRPHTVVWVFSEATDLADFMRYRPTSTQPPNYWHSFLERSFLRLTYHQVRGLFNAAKPSGVEYSGEIQVPGGRVTRVYFEKPAHHLTSEEFRALDGIARILAEARRLSAAQGARFLLVLAPDKYRVYHDLCQYPPESKCSRWVLSDLPERLFSAVASISPGIGYVDLTGALVTAARGGLLPYYSDDVHWSPEGHRVAAEAINAYLASQP